MTEVEQFRSQSNRSPTAPVVWTAPPLELRPLLARIEAAYHPLEVWLFGSRARGDIHPQSDWDLMVMVSDDASDDLLDPMFGWNLQKDSGVFADIVCARRADFDADLHVANTVTQEVERDGILLYAA